MKNSQQWSRRKFSKAVLSAQLFLASGALALTSSCLPETKTPTPGTMGKTSIDVLKLTMDVLIPKSDTMPAASEVGGLDYILKITGELPDINSLFEVICKSIDETSSSLFSEKYSRLNEEERITVLKSFESENEDLFTQLKNFVYESYYVKPEIWKRINYEFHSTGTAGPEMESFDPSLLDRVKNLASSFINI